MSQQFPVSWPKNQNQIKGIFAYHDTRPGGTSVRGQERSTGGLIRGIALRSSSGTDLVAVNVTPLDVSEDSARLVIRAKLHNWTAQPVPVTVTGQIHAANFSPDVSLKFSTSGNATPGDSQLTTEVRVEHPALWWSWDYGKPNLYKLSAQLANSAGSSIDTRQVQFGIRSISHDDQWVWHLNGKRIYQRGSNYIATQWMSQADRAWYERDVKLMKEANLNAIRVHAHVERPEFYDVADELGVMVWQDFPLQWGYTDMPSFHQNASQQARDMVERYFDHPSIIAWCIHNESPHAMDWMQKRDAKQNLQLDDDLVAEVGKLDPSRVAHRDSGTGDGHTYPGWYNGNITEFRTEHVPQFITEYGAEALPNFETLRTMFEAKDLFPSTDDGWEAWKYADFQPQQTFKDNGIDKGSSIEEFIRNSQAYQVKIIRYGTENFRRQKWTKSTGIYHFMFTDDWPSVTWSVLDYYRRPKPGYFALQSSMQPVLPSIDYQIDNPDAPLSVVIVNDLHQTIPATLKWRVTETGSRDGAVHESKITIPEDGVTQPTVIGPLPEVTRGANELQVWLEDSNGKHLGQSTLTRDDFIAQKVQVSKSE
jgi:beta-mannosidase